MIMYEAPVIKTVNVNYQLGQLDIGLEKGLFVFYNTSYPYQLHMDQRPELKKKNKWVFRIPFLDAYMAPDI